ncbi:universal stress protein [Intrasporangium flavum]|uniref:universal stress protein n=1 Tax=Intrasporangium flavum TaxID=1428657 RepID=UPI00096E35FB|nr:universal stress protein [Intrasporangium flavum]
MGCGRSAADQAAIATATAEAARRGHDLVLLVVDESSTSISVPGHRRLSAEAMHTAARRAAIVAEATDPTVPVEIASIPREDDAAMGLLAARAALFVAPARGLGGHQVLFLGRTADEVIRRAGCPVMLPHVTRRAPHVHPADLDRSPDRGPAVRAALTGRADDGEVLRCAVREARLRGDPLSVVRTVRALGGEAERQAALVAAWDAVRTVAESTVAESAALRCRAEVVVLDHRVDTLTTRCHPDDLVVVGGHDEVRRPGRGALVEMVRGSVLRGALDALPCDAMVVPAAVEPVPTPVPGRPLHHLRHGGPTRVTGARTLTPTAR